MGPHLLDASYSFDLDGEIITYTFNFGDGTSYTESVDNSPDGKFDGLTTYTYKTGGDYKVTLTVTDDTGLTDSETQVIEINDPVNDSPVAVDDTYTTNEDLSLTIPVGTGLLNNDSDLDLDSLVVLSNTNPKHIERKKNRR